MYIYIDTDTHTHTYVSIYIYIFTYVRVCVFQVWNYFIKIKLLIFLTSKSQNFAFDTQARCSQGHWPLEGHVATRKANGNLLATLAAFSHVFPKIPLSLRLMFVFACVCHSMALDVSEINLDMPRPWDSWCPNARGCAGLGSQVLMWAKTPSLPYFEWSPPWHIILTYSDFYIFYLTLFLTFFLAFYHGIYSDILSNIRSGILSEIYSDILSSIMAFYLAYVLTFCLTFFLAFYLTYVLIYIYYIALYSIRSDILSDMCSGPGMLHSIGARDRVWAQTCPAASGAGDMAFGSCRGGGEEEKEKEELHLC